MSNDTTDSLVYALEVWGVKTLEKSNRTTAYQTAKNIATKARKEEMRRLNNLLDLLPEHYQKLRSAVTEDTQLVIDEIRPIIEKHVKTLIDRLSDVDLGLDRSLLFDIFKYLLVSSVQHEVQNPATIGISFVKRDDPGENLLDIFKYLGASCANLNLPKKGLMAGIPEKQAYSIVDEYMDPDTFERYCITWKHVTSEYKIARYYDFAREIPEKVQDMIVKGMKMNGQKLVLDASESDVKCIPFTMKLKRLKAFDFYKPRGFELADKVMITDPKNNAWFVLKDKTNEIPTPESPWLHEAPGYYVASYSKFIQHTPHEQENALHFVRASGAKIILEANLDDILPRFRARKIKDLNESHFRSSGVFELVDTVIYQIPVSRRYVVLKHKYLTFKYVRKPNGDPVIYSSYDDVFAGTPFQISTESDRTCECQAFTGKSERVQDFES